jgi:hypothetical protein
MPHRRLVVLDAPARMTVCERERRDHGPKASLGERAAVLLAVADGASQRSAAARAGLKPRPVETVWSWGTRERQHGRVGWWMSTGRGRTPAACPARPRGSA